MKHLNSPRPRASWLKPTLAIFALSCAAAAAQALLSTAPASGAPAETAPPQQAAPPADLGDVELVTLRPTGFEQSEVKRPAGRFLLAVVKRDLVDDVTLRLLHQTGNNLREVRVGRGRRQYREAFDLPPGSYVLTTAERPDWVCEVTILPR